MLIASTTTLFGCATASVWQEPPLEGVRIRPVSDAHVHLFNASDLPVTGFANKVVIPMFLGSAHPILRGSARALSDILTNIIKPLAVTAIREERRLERAQSNLPGASDDISKSTFARRVDARIDRFVGTQYVDVRVISSDEAARFDLQQSYTFLSSLLIELDAAKNSFLAPRSLNSRQSSAARRRILQDAAAYLGPAEVTSYLARSSRFNEAQKNGISILLARVKWLFLLLQSRSRLLNTYLRTISDRHRQPTARVNLIINHLVDYDSWLLDRPSRRSSHSQQVSLWNKISTRFQDYVTIKNFAGFDPLKHTIERHEVHGHTPALTASSRYLETQLQHLREGKISGFKLYPPMGFMANGMDRVSSPNPICDQGQRFPRDCQFTSPTGVEDTVLEAWQRRFPTLSLSVSLQAGLDHFLSIVGRDANSAIPIMAHARASNEAGLGWGARANPSYWLDAIRAGRHLRLNLGHFTKACCFTEVMSRAEPTQDFHVQPGTCQSCDGGDVWAVQTTPQLFRTSSADVFSDLGYMPELVQIPGLAERFFAAVKKYCEGGANFPAADPNYEKLMFGSDWVMLGQEIDHEQYLKVIIDSMAGIIPDRGIENILNINGRRFLRI